MFRGAEATLARENAAVSGAKGKDGTLLEKNLVHVLVQMALFWPGPSPDIATAVQVLYVASLVQVSASEMEQALASLELASATFANLCIHVRNCIMFPTTNIRGVCTRFFLWPKLCAGVKGGANLFVCVYLESSGSIISLLVCCDCELMIMMIFIVMWG